MASLARTPILWRHARSAGIALFVIAGSVSSVVTAQTATAQSASCPLTGALAAPSAAVTIGSAQGSTNAVPATGYPYPSPLPTGATAQEPLAWPARYGQTVSVHGIVTAVTFDGSRGFYVQDCGDSDPNSSDAIFVFTGSTSLPPEVVGDVVTVTGRVGVFFGQTQISASATTSRVKVGTSPLPAPVDIDVPTDVINPDALLYFERLEGMRVRLSSPRVTGASFRLPGAAANPTTFYVVDSDDTAGLTGTGQLPLVDLGGGNVDYNPEAIEIADDAILGGGSLTQVVAAGTYPGMPPVQVGDTCSDIEGVLNYSFNSYKVFPTTDPETLCTTKAKPSVGSAGVRARVSGEVSVAAFNVENLFPINTPLSSSANDACTSAANAGPCYSQAELDTKLAKLTIGLVDEMKCPDVVAIAETYSEAMLLDLTAKLAVRGCPYAAKSFPTHDARGIENGVLYRTDRGLVAGVIALMPVTSADDPICPTDAFLSPSAGRAPLVANFTSSTGVAFTVIGNHWKSKGGDEPLFGQVQPPQRSSEDQKKCQAKSLRNYLNGLPVATKAIVLGDFNDFAFPEPGEGIDPITLLETSATMPLVEAAAPGTYSYNFSGRSQTIDHIFLSPAANALKTGASFAPLNSDFGDVWRDDATIAQGASDHNPDIVYLAFEAPQVEVARAATTPALTYLLLVAVSFGAWMLFSRHRFDRRSRRD